MTRVPQKGREKIKEFAGKHDREIVLAHCIFAYIVIGVCFILCLKGIITSYLSELIAGIPVMTHPLLMYFLGRLKEKKE